jgi:long-chain acyl-CoA synthetase
MAFNNLMSAVLWRARRRGPEPCLRFVRGDAVQTLSWEELAEHLTALMLGMDQLGLRAGARIGILAQNRWEWIAVDVAAAGRGLATVAIDPSWSDNLLVRIVDYAGVDSVFVESAEEAARIERLRPRLPRLGSVVVIESDGASGETLRFADLLEAGRAVADPRRVEQLLRAVRLDDLASVMFTGGSTGQPKGVIRTHGNTLSKAGAWFPWMGDETRPEPAPDDVLLNPLSFCHSAGRWGAHMALVRGATLALPRASALSLDDFAALTPTHMLAVPRVVLRLQKLLWKERRDPAGIRAALGNRLRCLVSGGAVLAPDLIDFFQRAGTEVRVAYGSTEAGVLAIHPVSAGRGLGRLIGAELRIEAGEILVRGPSVTPGYLDDPATTAAVRSEDGWWRTGDAGEVDASGHLWLSGRIRAMFNCYEGTNIDPLALEHLLESDPYISEAVLIGHRRPYLVALLVPDDERLAREAVSDRESFLRERVSRLNERLEDFEQIRRIRVVDRAAMAQVRSITVAQKVRVDRAAVEQVFAAEIRELYGETEALPTLTR